MSYISLTIHSIENSEIHSHIIEIWLLLDVDGEVISNILKFKLVREAYFWRDCTRIKDFLFPQLWIAHLFLHLYNKDVMFLVVFLRLKFVLLCVRIGVSSFWMASNVFLFYRELNKYSFIFVRFEIKLFIHFTLGFQLMSTLRMLSIIIGKYFPQANNTSVGTKNLFVPYQN